MLRKVLASFILCLHTLLVPAFLGAQENTPRVLVHILDYLSQDYAGAVGDGKVLNKAEYQEQVEFSGSALRIAKQLEQTRSDEKLLRQLEELQASILAKQDPQKVAALSRQAQAQVIQNSKLEIAPPQWPSLDKAKPLFAQNCASCHGESGKGDGPAAQSLQPPPVSFFNEQRIAGLSPFQVFNSIRLGIEGTAMPAFSQLSDQEVWALSFYVLSLRYEGLEEANAAAPIPSLSLDEIASSSDHAILEKYQLEGAEGKKVLAALRLHRVSSNANTLGTAKSLLEKARQNYLRGDYAQAKSDSLMAYLEGVEPVETQLRAMDAKLVAQIEEKMADLRVQIEHPNSPGALDSKFSEVNALLSQADAYLTSASNRSKGFVFFMAFSIILREGFEAVLILVTILGVVKMLGAKKAVRWTHAGWMAALGLGVLAWFFSGWLLGMSGAKRETMEGLTSLLAMAVLLYVGFWLHSKSEIGRWTAYIKKQMDSALQGSRLFGIGFISFLAVFREVFETVLFLRALWLDGASEEKLYLLLGLLSAFVLIFILAFFLLKWSVKLPLNKLFSLSSTVMVVLALILTGKGLRALQVAGHLSLTPLSLPLNMPFLGIYPSLETLLSQALVLALIGFLWAYEKRTRAPQRA